MIPSLYKGSLSLLTDLYQLTMSYGYFKSGRGEQEAVFNLFFRKHPFGGNYTVCAGIDSAIEYMKDFTFSADDVEFLGTLKGNDGKELFSADYLQYLADMKFSCTVDGIPEGTIVFPHEPILRIKGPIIQCQILETALLNIINFQTLIATKTSRICHSALGEPVLEFGLRRAQGIDGALSATKASIVGGAVSTSNVLAAKLLGVPVKGTHAHSWVMSFPTEQESFEEYAEHLPNNCVFLVDTFDTVNGVKKAIAVSKKLRERGHEPIGIRLDSGDMAELSIKARKQLDESGFPDAKIFASNDLDEYTIADLKKRGAKIDVWGVGTKLVTAYDQPALGGVYKLAAIKEESEWSYKVKLSEEKIKVSNPGILQVRRVSKNGEFVGDVLFNEEFAGEETLNSVRYGLNEETKFDSSYDFHDLLVPFFKEGELIYQVPTIQEAAETKNCELGKFEKQIVANEKAEIGYPLYLETRLNQLKDSLISAQRPEK